MDTIGDITQDGITNVLDLVLLISWIINGINPTVLEMGIANIMHDNALDIFDNDFTHPKVAGDWISNYRQINDSDNNWSHLTEGYFKESEYIFTDSGQSHLGYKYKNI